MDLKSAYSDKIRDYVRTFCFLNLDNQQTPAVLVVLDNMTTAKPEFTATALDTGSGVKQVTFEVTLKSTPASWQTISVDTVPEAGNTYAADWPATGSLSAGLAEGQYLFRVVVVDNVGNLHAVAARLIVACARMRKESRGLHYNLDYPEKDDHFWLKDTVVSREDLWGKT